jgi:hypothetical protein
MGDATGEDVASIHDTLGAFACGDVSNLSFEYLDPVC